MGQINPIQTPPIWPGLQQMFGDWMFQQFYNSWDGQNRYPGTLSPDINNTMLPMLWGAWNPQGDNGTNFLQQYLSGGGGPDPFLQQSYTGAIANGGPSDLTQQIMMSMLQNGGYGPGADAMTTLMNWGVTNPKARGMVDIAELGGAGEWGQNLRRRATGQTQVPGAQYLLPFLTATPYKAPEIAGLPQGRRGK